MEHPATCRNESKSLDTTPFHYETTQNQIQVFKTQLKLAKKVFPRTL